MPHNLSGRGGGGDGKVREWINIVCWSSCASRRCRFHRLRCFNCFDFFSIYISILEHCLLWDAKSQIRSDILRSWANPPRVGVSHMCKKNRGVIGGGAWFERSTATSEQLESEIIVAPSSRLLPCLRRAQHPRFQHRNCRCRLQSSTFDINPCLREPLGKI